MKWFWFIINAVSYRPHGRRVPLWLYLLVGILLINAALHFGLLFFLNEGGVTAEVPDALRAHGEVIRYLTEQEYFQHKTYEDRLFSASLAWGYTVFLITILNRYP